MKRVTQHIKILQIISLFIGVIIFAYFVYSIGFYEILNSFRLVGFGFVILIILSAFRFLARSLAWFYCIDKGRRNVSLFTLFNARLAGESVRVLSFTGPFLGEPSKAFLLRDQLPMKYGVSSILVDNLCFMLTAVFVIISGLFLLVANFTLQNSVKLMGFILCGFIVATVLAVHYILSRRAKAITISVAWLAKKTGIVWFKKQEFHVVEMENNIHDFYNRRGTIFYWVLTLEMIAHLINIFEVYFILYLINVDATIVIAYIVEALSKVVNVVFFFVPGQIGVLEGSNGFLLSILGLGFAAGVTLALVEKIRTIFWIGYGLIIWIIAFRKKANRKAQDNVAASSEIKLF